MATKLPDISQGNGNNKVLISSRSVENYAKKALRKDKRRRSRDDKNIKNLKKLDANSIRSELIVERKQRKHESTASGEGIKLERRRAVQGNRNLSDKIDNDDNDDDIEDSFGEKENVKPKIKTNKVVINPKKLKKQFSSASQYDETANNKKRINPKSLKKQFSSATYGESDAHANAIFSENPFRKLVTRHLNDPHGVHQSEAIRDIKKFWLYVVVIAARTSFLTLVRSPCQYNTPEAIALAQKRLMANMMLVVYVKRKCKWFANRIRIKTEFVRNHGWKLVLFWRCIQRRKAVRLLRRMLTDFECFRLPYVMLRYRVNAVHLQRYLRSFLDVTAARKRVLFMKWRRIEHHMRANLIPQLLEQRAREEAAKKVQERSKWQGVKINSEVLPDLAPHINLITKKTAALHIQINKSEAAIHKHRMEMLSKKKKKKSSHIKLPPMPGKSIASPNSTQSVSSPKSTSSSQKEAKSADAEEDDSKKILALIARFVYECRRNCKEAEQHKIIVKEKKRKGGMTCEEARNILTNPFAAKMFAEELSNTEVKFEKINLLIFTGQPDYAFRLLVENYLRAEFGFELKEDYSYY